MPPITKQDKFWAKARELNAAQFGLTTCSRLQLEALYADHILNPQAQPEVVLFCCQMKINIFLIIAPKFQRQIHYTLKVIAENVPTSGIPILIFLLIFITASSLVSHMM